MHTVLDLGLVLEVRLQAGWEDNPSLMIFSWLLGDGRRPAKLMLKMRSEDFSLASKGFLYLKTYIFHLPGVTLQGSSFSLDPASLLRGGRFKLLP